MDDLQLEPDAVRCKLLHELHLEPDADVDDPQLEPDAVRFKMLNELHLEPGTISRKTNVHLMRMSATCSLNLMQSGASFCTSSILNLMRSGARQTTCT